MRWKVIECEPADLEKVLQRFSDLGWTIAHIVQCRDGVFLVAANKDN